MRPAASGRKRAGAGRGRMTSWRTWVSRERVHKSDASSELAPKLLKNASPDSGSPFSGPASRTPAGAAGAGSPPATALPRLYSPCFLRSTRSVAAIFVLRTSTSAPGPARDPPADGARGGGRAAAGPPSVRPSPAPDLSVASRELRDPVPMVTRGSCSVRIGGDGMRVCADASGSSAGAPGDRT